MHSFDQLTDEQLGVNRYACTPEELADLKVMSARYIAEYALRQGVPLEDVAEHGPFFPRYAKLDRYLSWQFVANPQDVAPEI